MEKEIIEPRNDVMSEKYGAKAIAENKLEVFENRSQDQNYVISFTCPEYTSLCPRSGFPDFATIYIDYVPGKFCVELKALKLYLNSYRDKGIFHEDVTNHLLRDLVALLKPRAMRVVADFTVRGNIHTVVAACHYSDELVEYAKMTVNPGDLNKSLPRLTILGRDY